MDFLFLKYFILGLAFILLCQTESNAQAPTEDLSGLFPVVFNLATRARIEANATCGEMTSEVYCKLVEHIPLFSVENRHCDICDARSSNPNRRHHIRNAIDGSQKWWQSPTLTSGAGYNYVTITLDLGQIYQIAYIIIKSANSPRPGNWILERSLDGVNFMPWQYFTMTDEECLTTYGIRPTIGVPTFLSDDQVICTSRYSTLNPLENGEIFVSLVNGRPGVFQPSKILLDFTSARYVRLRFQKIRTLNADLMTFETFDPIDLDPTVTRRYFYSVKDISIGGQCICYGHAAYCRRHDFNEDQLQCQCLHNTAGDNCEKCLPRFNQMPWQVGGIRNIGCTECNCHNKADECVYNATVDAMKLSLNMEGKYVGGGVCLNCRDYTAGINCECCLDGYYRRPGTTADMDRPCIRCRCRETMTSTDKCVLDDSRIGEGLNAGDCICKDGYAGPNCNQCAYGYYGFPNCRKCLCNPAGSVDPESCTGACVCKQNVAGSRCDYCESGHFNLDKENPLGCVACFCFGVSSECKSVAWGLTQVTDLDEWVLSTLEPGGLTLLPRYFDGWLEAKTYLLKIDQIDPRSYSQEDIHYWVAPMPYLGNKLSSYGGFLRFAIKYILDERVPAKYYLSAPNVVIEGSGITLITNKEYMREIRENAVSVPLYETSWFHLSDNRQATREDLMKVLYKVDRLLLRATYHTAQDTVYLKDVRLDTASPLVMDGSSMPNVEQCQCPEGYAGLSCESCAPGWSRVNNQLYRGVCRKCQCNNHASECDSFTGKCLNCQHSTTGDNCDVCLPGFYGDPRYGRPDDCKPCACPLIAGTNFFAERCLAMPTIEDRDAYQCLNCLEGYTGSRCEMCAPGFYGNPSEPGGSCRRCSCGGNIDMNREGNCNNVTGICNLCANNTEGEYCEKCVRGYYGSAVNGDCRPCNCYEKGSNNMLCHPRNGQCSCSDRFTGRRCDRCQQGYGNVDLGCERCTCDRSGSISLTCDPVSGQCRCRPGVGGMNCDQCKEGFFGSPQSGCQDCTCYEHGTVNSVNCASGICQCKPNVEGRQCDRCRDQYFGLDSGNGCVACNCNSIGSYHSRCEEVSGQCECKPGVGGRRCDECLPSYYGLSNRGCSRCQPCNKIGHICDPITGECACPPNTEGPNCEKCTTGGWGYDEDKGCKVNVIGKFCDECRPDTFSLDKYNPKGCTECYCFYRGKSCQQAPYVWSTIELPKETVQFVETEEEGSLLKREFGYLYIDNPSIYTPEDILERHVYWRLRLFSDMTLSYGGNLSFVHYYEGSVSHPIIESPMVIMVGNGFHIEYGKTTIEPMNPLAVDVPLHENYWSLPNQDGPIERRLMMVILQNVEAIFVRAVEKGLMLNAELNSISIQKAVPPGPNVTSTQIARGVELCECPVRYSGESCQNPARGYYRVVPDSPDINFSTPETVVGYVRRCQCFGHSDVCDPETGVCQDCQHNTKGDSCDLCAEGFHGVATKGTADDCQPCACPLPNPSNNFSPECVSGRKGIICTACEDGYTGSRCESCSPGYYGNPFALNDTCKPCDCNRDGSQSNLCDQTTGQCPCVRGVTGRTCDECSDVDSAVQNGECVSCYTGCTGILLAELANLTYPSYFVNVTGATYPWERLFDFKDQIKGLKDKLKAAEEAGVTGLQDYKDMANKFNTIADKRLEEAEEIEMQAQKLREGASVVLNNATILEEEVNQALEDVEAQIKDLDELIEKLLFNESAIDMEKTLKKARDILDTIENRDFEDANEAARNENKLAEMLSEKMKYLDDMNINTTDVRKMVDDLNKRLQDILNETQAADKTAQIALDKIKELKDLLARLKSIRDEIMKINEDTRTVINDESLKILDQADDNLMRSEGQSQLVDFGISELNKKINDLTNALPNLIDLTRRAIEHALNLTAQADELEELFSKTRNLAEKAVKAANAYKSIVDAIKEAEDSADSAKKAAQESTDLAGVSDLESEVSKLINISQEQLRQAKELQKETKDLSKSTTDIESDLAEASKNHNRVKELLEELKRKLNQAYPADLFDDIQDVNQVSQRSNEMTDEALELMNKFNSSLASKLQDLQNFDINDFNYDISSDLIQAEDEAKKEKELENYEKQMKSKINAALRKVEDISINLDRLKEKIRDARSSVNSMKLSLQADGKCHRSYRSPLSSSSTNEIRFSFKMNSSASDDMLLLLLQQSPQEPGEEFLATEIRESKILFSWNSGKGQGSVSHPQTVQGDKWYAVVAKRVGAVGQLKVWNIEEATEKSTQAETASTGAGCSLMNLNENAIITFAGSSDLIPKPLGVTKNNFVGCMGGIILDSNPVGTYNFKTNEVDHCDPCMEVPTVRAFSLVHKFSGYGFAVFLVERYNSKRTKVEFQFKTFYEDSMLFFVGNPAMGDFLSIQLKDGKVAVAFSMGGLSSTSGSSNNTYNNNRWTRIIFERNRLTGVLTVGSEQITMKAPGSKTGLELQGSPMFFGGLPLQFNLDKFKKYIKEHPPFFYGCMKKLNFGSLPPDDDTSTLVNVGTGSGCRENGVHKVDFYGDGYLMLKNNKIEFSDQENDISMTFVTNYEDGVLLIARDIAGENYYSVSLVGGMIDVRLKSSGTSPVIIKSSKTFNDGQLHCVSLLKNGRNTEVTVDDVQIGTTESRDISFNNVGDLYLGGSPVDTGDITPTNEGLDGCISDVIANKELLSMSDAMQYKQADVGRCRFTDNFPPAILTSASADNGNGQIADSPYAALPSKCATPNTADVQKDAVSVGNDGKFYVRLPRGLGKDTYNSFSISFDFRTFNPHGMFGYLHNPSTGFYFGIQLVDGKLQIKYIHKKAPLEINFSKVLNDGRWHSVLVEKLDRKISASHDSEKNKKRNIRRRMSDKMQFIFGGPPEAKEFADSNVKLVPYSIRGCVRALELNGKDFNITNAQVVQDAGVCYKKVEGGAFLEGNAWGMLSNNFVIEPDFSISMEFRTTRQDAILASVSSKNGENGFTLELHKGMVEFTLVFSSRINRVVSNSAKINIYCDNEWHKVEAKITATTISLMLDNNKPVTMDVYSGIRRTPTYSVLFIGGYKDGFIQGPSISRKFFHGCLRNVHMNGKQLDWYDDIMNSANIKRTGCPKF